MQLINQTMLAERLGVHRTTVFRLVQAGKLPEPMTVGKVQLWPVDQIETFISAKVQNMTTPLQKAQDAYQIVSTNFTEQRNDLNALKAELRKAPEHNSELIESQADALAEGLEAPEGELIDVKTVQQAIDVKEAVMVKLTAKLEDARLAKKYEEDGLYRQKQRDALKILTKRYGYDVERKLFRMDIIAQLAGQQLIDLLTLAKIAFGNSFSMAELFSKRCYPLTDTVKAASRSRVDQLLDAA